MNEVVIDSGLVKYCRLNLIKSGRPKRKIQSKFGMKKNEYNLIDRQEKRKERKAEYWAKKREDALTLICKVGEQELKCLRCGCKSIEHLQINHKDDYFKGKRPREEIGTSLYLKILKMENKDIGDKYNVLCRLCNWADLLEKKYNIRYQISFLS